LRSPRSLTGCAASAAPDVPPVAAGEAAVARFEALYRAQIRRRALTTGGGTAVFGLAFAASAIVGEIDPARLAAGLPNILDYVGRTLPAISREKPLSDLGEWFWAIDL